jgi:hypothetical protein
VPSKIVDVPAASKKLARNGLTMADVQADLRWQLVFDSELILDRRQCDTKKSNSHDIIVKAPELVFPKALNRFGTSMVEFLLSYATSLS